MAEAVGVVGGGIMGAGIAEVTARAGYDVLVREVDDAAVAAAQARLTASLGRAVRAGRLDAADRDSAPGPPPFTTDLAELADRHLVVAAVRQGGRVKTHILAALRRTAR